MYHKGWSHRVRADGALLPAVHHLSSGKSFLCWEEGAGRTPCPAPVPASLSPCAARTCPRQPSAGSQSCGQGWRLLLGHPAAPAAPSGTLDFSREPRPAIQGGDFIWKCSPHFLCGSSLFYERDIPLIHCLIQVSWCGSVPRDPERARESESVASQSGCLACGVTGLLLSALCPVSRCPQPSQHRPLRRQS